MKDLLICQKVLTMKNKKIGKLTIRKVTNPFGLGNLIKCIFITKNKIKKVYLIMSSNKVSFYRKFQYCFFTRNGGVSKRI